MLGQDLMARLSLFDHFSVTGTHQEHLDLTWEARRIHRTLDERDPDIIVNAAAFTAVDAAESQYEKARQVNASGPEALAGWCAQNRRYLIYISTDYVFDGTKGSPYTPGDTPHPINRYGETKLAGEQAVLATAPDHAVVVRTSWLFGPGGKNFVPFVLDAARQRKPIKVVNDQWGTPTWTGNLCRMLLDVMEERPLGVHHGCSRGFTTRYDQALFLCQCLNIPPDFITPVDTASFNFPARRPRNTTMAPSFDSAMDWREATAKFLQTLGLLTHHA